MKKKFFIGSMSKNIVESLLEEKDTLSDNIGLISSRRQIDLNRGYVNNWTTSEYSNFVNNQVLIQRDHGGIWQGLEKDDGILSFEEDAKYFDIIHVDPWKRFKSYEKGLEETIRNINYLHKKNKNIKFEVGTEEAIRKFSINELDRFLSDLMARLDENVFKQIIYVVVQSGVHLDLLNMTNTGNFDQYRLTKMIDICKKYNKMSKEHNGDYLTLAEYRLRFNLGLDSINIAPEFGQIETIAYFQKMKEKNINSWYDICLKSEKWKKWIDEKKVPELKKQELIKVCGHYVFSKEEFLGLKPNIDDYIKTVIKNKLGELNEIC